VSTAAGGPDAALIEGWYRQGPMKTTRAGDETNLKEIALNEIRHISTSAQRDALRKLDTTPSVGEFMREFWAEIDPSPETAENELQREYYERFAFANEHYASFQNGWKTDRGRVYLLHGAPDDIQYEPWVNPNLLGNGANIKDAEVWIYVASANSRQLPSIFDGFQRGMKKFVFADFEGLRDYRQIYSTEVGELSDPRVFMRY
jgi:GWxTD domain-containing protein